MSQWNTIRGRYGSDDGEISDVRIDKSTDTIQTIEYEHHEIHANSHYFLEGFVALGNTETLDFCVTAPPVEEAHVKFAYKSSLKTEFRLYEGTDFDADGTLAVQFGNNRAQCHSGYHTPVGSSATVMTDANATFVVDALIGWKIYNITDGSYGIITDNDGTTVTVASLTGGTDNDWDTGDQYEINQSLTTITTDATVNIIIGVLIASSTGGSGTNPSTGEPGGSERVDEIILKPGVKYMWRFTSGAASNTLSYKAEWYEHTPKH